MYTALKSEKNLTQFECPTVKPLNKLGCKINKIRVNIRQLLKLFLKNNTIDNYSKDIF